MNSDSVFASLSEANPVPDPARYHQMTIDGRTFLAATKERTLHMETITRTPETQEPPTRRRGLAIAAAVFVIVIVGVALAIRPGSDVVVTPPTPTTAATIPAPTTTIAAVVTIAAPPFSTPAEAADAYLSAKFTGDYQQLAPLLGVDGTNISYMFTTPGDAERMGTRFAWEQATFGPYRDLECAETTSNTVTCTYITEFLDMTSQGADGTIMYTQSFTLDPDGFLLLVGLEMPAFTEQHRAAARAWNMWLIERHPDLIEENDALFGTGVVTRTFEEIRADWIAAIDEYLGENG